MTSEEIIKSLNLLAKLMELHNDNPFKIKSLANAVYKLDKIQMDIASCPIQDIEAIEGIGKGLVSKIEEIRSTGELKELNDWLTKTPLGVVEMLGIKGIGPKKVALLWQDLGCETVGELYYACQENRLVALKGFGAKTQDQVKQAIEFKMASSGKKHFASLEKMAFEIVEKIKQAHTVQLIEITGDLRRKMEIAEQIDILIGTDKHIDLEKYTNNYSVKVNFLQVEPELFYNALFETSSTEAHKKWLMGSETIKQNFSSEIAIYESFQKNYVPPELRDGLFEDQYKADQALIELKDLKGILHNHSTYSDGVDTLETMATYCKELGYEYLGICDHSQAAFYAEGMKPDKVFSQHTEIDKLNQKLFPFKILKGVESDILNDGSLDYEEDILKQFDFIVASVHSNLKMDEAKANERLIKAIENPYTSILGHPTGRLLLSRAGYPIDHKRIIDACAANNVVIELNAHPWRLDIDWRWIPYCLEKGVKISINPDAHQKEGYHDMYYGVQVARKGLLTKEMCLNAMGLAEIELFFNQKSSK
jgi:DNA polymerase (family X)